MTACAIETLLKLVFLLFKFGLELSASRRNILPLARSPHRDDVTTEEIELESLDLRRIRGAKGRSLVLVVGDQINFGLDLMEEGDKAFGVGEGIVDVTNEDIFKGDILP